MIYSNVSIHFVDYPELLKLHQKNKGPEIGTNYKTDRAAADFSQSIAETYHQELIENLSKTWYYSILNDGSSDTSVSEKKLVYVLFLKDRFPKIKFVSIENIKKQMLRVFWTASKNPSTYWDYRYLQKDHRA